MQTINNRKDKFKVFSNTLFARILLGILNIFIFIILFNYIETLIIYCITHKCSFIIDAKFIIIPFFSVYWLRKYSIIKKESTIIPKQDDITYFIRKVIINSIILFSLLYDTIIILGFHTFFKSYLFPIREIPTAAGEILTFLYIDWNYNSLALFIMESLIVAFILLAIFFNNFKISKTCPNCGKSISKKQKFCTKCGQQLK